MKLDRMKFAALVGWIAGRFAVQMDYDDYRMLDNLVDIDVTPVEVPGKANPADINALMSAIHQGNRIDAIKAYRSLTGFGLKEAKDAVEKEWKDSKREYRDAMNAKINMQLDRVIVTNPYMLAEFTDKQLYTIKDFINSF